MATDVDDGVAVCIGCTVELRGLSRPSLNGAVGVVVSCDAERARFGVRGVTGGILGIKRENLLRVPARPEALPGSREPPPVWVIGGYGARARIDTPRIADANSCTRATLILHALKSGDGAVKRGDASGWFERFAELRLKMSVVAAGAIDQQRCAWPVEVGKAQRVEKGGSLRVEYPLQLRLDEKAVRLDPKETSTAAATGSAS